MISRRRIIVTVVALLLVGVPLLVRQSIIAVPMGAGVVEESPDGRFEASAMDMHEPPLFWGEGESYTDFTIKGRKGEVVNHLRTDRFQWFPNYVGAARDEKPPAQVVTWSKDSRMVTFRFADKQIVLTVPD